MALEMYAYLMICADIILLISLPLQLRILNILLSANKQFMGLQSDFYRCLTQILIVDLTSALICIILVEPATNGVLREFFENNSGWLSKIVIFQASPLCILSAYLHCIIAVNRLTAMLFTMKHKLIWTARVLKYFHIGGWFLAIFFSLPLIWPIQGSHTVLRSPFNNQGLAFVLTTSEANLAYQAAPVIIGAFLELVIIFVYIIIILNSRRYKEIAKVVIRTTAASVLMCSGGWFLMIFMAVASSYGHATGDNLFPLEVFYAFFKMGFAVNGSITSWVVLFLFKNIRHRVFSFSFWSRSDTLGILSISTSSRSNLS